MTSWLGFGFGLVLKKEIILESPHTNDDAQLRFVRHIRGLLPLSLGFQSEAEISHLVLGAESKLQGYAASDMDCKVGCMSIDDSYIRPITHAGQVIMVRRVYIARQELQFGFL